LNNERISAINECIQSKGQVHLNDLQKLFPDVSAMTIRRDIDYLEEQGQVVRTRGGAKSISHLTHPKEDVYQKRAFDNIDAKNIIAKKALDFNFSEGAVYFDSGTTVTNIVKNLNSKDIFAITSAPNIAMELCRGGCDRSVLLGGNLNRDNLAVSGASAVAQIENINITTAFIGASGFSLNAGFTIGNIDESELKKAAIAKASCVVIVMDSSKLGKNLPFTFASLDDIDYLLTNKELSEEIIKAANDANVKIL